jgi:KDO2-lipid IV(A) lauroyltransferase
MAALEYGAYRSAAACLRTLPRPLQRAFVAAFARLARAVDPGHSRSARRFLEQAFGAELTLERREQLVLAAWRQLIGLVVGDGSEEIPDERLLEHFDLDLHPDVERVKGSGRGAVLVCPHLGAWQAAAAVMPLLGFDPLYMISRPSKNRLLSRHFQRSIERRGLWLLPRHGALRPALRVLRAGGTVAMAPDQRARINPVIAPVFGRPAKTEQGPALFMRRLNVPVVPMACFHTEKGAKGDRFELVIPTVLWPEDYSGHSSAELTAIINLELERLILRHPEQYMWIHDRFRGAPEAR